MMMIELELGSSFSSVEYSSTQSRVLGLSTRVLGTALHTGRRIAYSV